MNERFGGFRQTLVVCLEPSPSAQPRKRSLDDPAPRQNCEAALSLWLANDFQPDLSPWPEAPDPVLQTAAGISAISPHHAQAPEFISQGTQQYPGCCPVLCIGRCDDHQKYEAERIDQHVPFASRDVLPGIIASDPLVLSSALTGCQGPH